MTFNVLLSIFKDEVQLKQSCNEDQTTLAVSFHLREFDPVVSLKNDFSVISSIQSLKDLKSRWSFNE